MSTFNPASLHKEAVRLSSHLIRRLTHNGFFNLSLLLPSKFEYDRTISLAVNQIYIHFPPTRLPPFHTAGTTVRNCSAKTTVFPAGLSHHTRDACHISQIDLRLGLLSGSVAFATDCIDVLCTCTRGFLVCACTCPPTI